MAHRQSFSGLQQRCLSSVVATWILTDSAYFLPSFSLVFLSSSILLHHWLKAASLLTNDNKTYSQHTEGNPISSSVEDIHKTNQSIFMDSCQDQRQRQRTEERSQMQGN